MRALPHSSVGIWKFRYLLYCLVARDLKVKYQRSILGFFWTLLNPLMTCGILICVFSFVIRIQIENYWAFLISGFFVWNFVQQVLNTAAYVINAHSGLRRSVAFPGEILIFSVTASKLVEFVVEICIVIVVLAVFHHGHLPTSFALLPLLIFTQVTLSVGLMYPIAILAVLYHDVQHALPIVLTSLFYATPVFYPLEIVPDVLKPYYAFNPFSGLLSLYHLVLFEGQFPSIGQFSTILGLALTIYLAGAFIFNRYKYMCVEIA